MEGFPVNSSTFNSKPLIRLIMLAAFGFTAYACLLQALGPEVSAFQNQWVKNYAVSERFIYGEGEYPAVIVGTSLAARLRQEQLGSDVYNLAFANGSVLAGLHIILKSGRLPKTIFIETNLAEHELDESMLDNLFMPGLWQIKRQVVALQYTYQPVNLLLSALNGNPEKSRAQPLADTPNPRILKQFLQRTLKDNNSADGLESKDELTELKTLITQLKSRGVRIVFFEMPVHPDLLSSPKYAGRRQILQALFPDDEFHFLSPAAASAYLTSDGAHLLPKSACRFSLVLKQMISQAVTDGQEKSLAAESPC
jgi:hypothetical protein